MKQKIRTGVFESNSSSSHVLTLSDGTKEFFMDNSMVPDEDGNISLSGGEFGWEWEKYNDAWTKANYAAEYCKGRYPDVDMLTEVIQEQTQCKKVIVSPTGYIDHQSDSVCHPAFASKDDLRNFIFNKHSYLFTGNDNSSAHPNFYDIDTEYKMNLSVEGVDKKIGFVKKPNK
jgi:hypothetical protein